MNTGLDPDAIHSWLASELSTRLTWPTVISGVDDDDCMVIPFGNRLLVATTDFVNARPIALELGIGSHYEVGRLAVASNLSDLCGTGAQPSGLLMAIMFPRSGSESEFKQLVRGIRHESSRWNVPVLGGDTKLGDSLAVAGVAFGSVESRENLFLRYAAKAGDALWVSGSVGSCCSAVIGLASDKFQADWRSWAIAAVTEPQLPLRQSRALSDARLGRGGTDISDGLGMDLSRLCISSNVGAILESRAIPLCDEARDVARSLEIPDWALAFGTGGDFQFLVTADPTKSAELESMGFIRIGQITDSKHIRLSLSNGATIELPTDGHRDARNMTFAQEVEHLVLSAAKLAT